MPPGLAPPYPPGASPFKVKGVLYRGTRDYFEVNCPGGFAALLKNLGDPDLRAFAGQKFLAGGSYDVLPVMALIEAEARTMRQSFSTYLHHRGAWQADTDIKGVHRMLAKLVSPEAFAVFAPRVFLQFFNFGHASSESPQPRVVDLTFTDVPAVLLDWWESGISSYLERAIELAGADSAKVVLQRPKVTGTRDLIELASFHYWITWVK